VRPGTRFLLIGGSTPDALRQDTNDRPAKAALACTRQDAQHVDAGVGVARVDEDLLVLSRTVPESQSKATSYFDLKKSKQLSL